MNQANSALRRGRHSSVGQVYLVTFTTARRQPHFTQWSITVDAARQLAAPRNWQGSTLLAWVLMPDHWHGLVELGVDDDLSSRIGWVKAESARRLRKAHPGLKSVWARAFHDRALRADEDLVVAARYLVMNPVRAGLAARVGAIRFGMRSGWVGKSSRL